MSDYQDFMESRCGVNDPEWDSEQCTCVEEVNPYNGRIVNIEQLCSYCAEFFSFLYDGIGDLQ